MPYASLRELLTLGGLGEPDTGLVEITGATPCCRRRIAWEPR